MGRGWGGAGLGLEMAAGGLGLGCQPQVIGMSRLGVKWDGAGELRRSLHGARQDCGHWPKRRAKMTTGGAEAPQQKNNFG